MKEKFKQMGTEGRAFFATGLLLLLTGLVSLVDAILAFASGETRDSSLARLESTMKDSGIEGDPFQYAQIVAGIMLGIVVVSFLFYLFLGYKAIKNSMNPSTDKAHIIIAIIFLVISGLSLVLSIPDFEISAFLSALVSTGIMAFYVIEGKKVRKLAE